MHPSKILPLIILLALTANAAAETNKCTDAKGKISYINAPCPADEKTQRVNDDNISVIDASEDRARQAEERSKEKTRANDPTNTPDADILPRAPTLTDPSLAKVREAQNFIQRVMTARNYLGISIAIFLIAAAVFMLARRSRKPLQPAISHEISKTEYTKPGIASPGIAYHPTKPAAPQTAPQPPAAQPQNNPTPPRPPEP